jgi:hypothetical protein
VPQQRPIDRDQLASTRLPYPGDFVKNPNGLVAIVLDAAYLGASAAALGERPPYAGLVEVAADGRPWVGTGVVLAGRLTAGIRRFVGYLGSLGFDVIVSRRRNVCGRAKVSDDIAIAAEAVCAACDPRITEIVLCTGDGDLSHVVDVCHRRGKRCTVAAYEHSLSSLLRRRADRLIILDALHADATAEAA